MTEIESGKKMSPDHQTAFGLVARDSSGVLSPFTFSRRNNGDDDVTIKILYCGICHSDLHYLKDEWKNTIYPIVPGHEIVGVITKTGRNVQKLKMGDNAGVGCMVDSCRSCIDCNNNNENHCSKMVLVCNAIDFDGEISYGGFSDVIVVKEHFVVKFPESMPLDKGAPLMCAGISVYSPMKSFSLDQPGKHLGVVGLGGLGHGAVKFGKAFGMKVTVISSSLSKRDEAIKNLGADDFIVSSCSEQMQAAMGSMDGIIDTVSGKHEVVPLIALLKNHGTMVMIGVPEQPMEFHTLSLINGGKVLAGSHIGGMKETQKMIDFAAEHGVAADIELIGADYVNEAMNRLAKFDVRYRFVIDVGNTLAAA